MIRGVIVELFPPETVRAFEAMRELRPGLTSPADFADRVDQRQRPQGYRLLASVVDHQSSALSVLGFRVADNLAWGHHLYIDDLSTVGSARGQGHARNLLAWVHEEARRLGCGQIHLDSGVGPDRLSAHRLYLNTGYRISSHHFSREA
jgi:GNAT superfamily N-acetyltransferase